MIKIYLIIIFTTIANIAFAQGYVDALLAKLDAHTQNDTAKIRTLLLVAKSFEQRNPKNGIPYTDNAISLSKSLGDDEYLLKALSAKASLLIAFADYRTAFDYHQKALIVAEKLNNKLEQGKQLSAIGAIYSSLGLQGNCISYHLQALPLFRQTTDTAALAMELNQIGNAYRASGNHKESMVYFSEELTLMQALKDSSGIARGLTNIACFLGSEKKYDSAIQYINTAFTYANKNTKIYGISGYGFMLYEMAGVYIGLQQYKTAIDTLTASLQQFKTNNDAVMIAALLNDIGHVHALNSNYPMSLEFLYKAKAFCLTNGFTNTYKTVLLSLSEVYDHTKNYDSAYHYYKGYISIRDSLASEEKKSDITRSGFEYEFSKKQDSLRFSQEIAGIRQRQEKKQQWLYSGGILLLLLAGAGYYWNRSRLKQAALTAQLATEKAEQEKKEAAFQHKLGDITLSALRSQMNPHFIFNCLNSIKLYSAQNNAQAASDYVSKFSRLIRQTLENSHSDRISLTAEIQALELYIQMEAMRFKEKLQYTISIGDTVDAEYIEIPPLLLQPYVENAIWHGLMQKEEGGIIRVEINEDSTQHLLIATITDNGIGRKKAMEIKSKTATKHKSYGMKMTSERIALINQMYNSKTVVEVTDLYNETGEAAGTKVTIQIPI
jgi:ribosomal protein S13